MCFFYLNWIYWYFPNVADTWQRWNFRNLLLSIITQKLSKHSTWGLMMTVRRWLQWMSLYQRYGILPHMFVVCLYVCILILIVTCLHMNKIKFFSGLLQVGELIGGSQREERYDVIQQRYETFCTLLVILLGAKIQELRFSLSFCRHISQWEVSLRITFSHTLNPKIWTNQGNHRCDCILWLQNTRHGAASRAIWVVPWPEALWNSETLWFWSWLRTHATFRHWNWEYQRRYSVPQISWQSGSLISILAWDMAVVIHLFESHRNCSFFITL